MVLTIASAVVTAVAKKSRVCKIGTNLFRRAPEIVQTSWLVRENIARGNEDIIGVHSLSCIRHPK